MKYAFLALVLSLNSFAGDSWLCTEDSSQIQGSQILACGVGHGANEAIARKAALTNAKEEFSAICDVNTICGEHKFRARPSRSTCENKGGVWSCHRLVVYGIEEDLRVAHNDPANFTTYVPNVRDEGMDLMDELINRELRKQLKEGL